MTPLLHILFAIVAALPGLPRLDIHGDRIPEGALARFGSVRFWVKKELAHKLSPDGKTLAVDSLEGVTLMDVETGRPWLRLPVERSDNDRVYWDPFAFSPDSKTLVYYRADTARVYYLPTGRRRHTVTVPDSCSRVDFFPDGKRFVITSDWEGSYIAWIYNAESGKREAEQEIGQFIGCLSPTGRFYLGRVIDDRNPPLVDAATGKYLFSFARATEDSYVGAAFGPGDRHVFLATNAGRILEFDTQTGKQRRTAKPPRNNYENSPSRFCLSPDGRIAYVRRENEPTDRYDLRAHRWLEPLPAMPGTDLMPHPDGKRVLFVDTEGKVRRWDLTTRSEQLPPGFLGSVSVVPSPNGQRVAVTSGGPAPRLDVFDADGRPIWSVLRPGVPRRPHWSPDGRSIACAGERDATIYDAVTGNVIHAFPTPDVAHDFTSILGFTTDDRLVAALDRGQAIVTFDLKNGDAPVVVYPENVAVEDVSPDGRMLVFGNGSPKRALFDMTTGRFRVGWTEPAPPRGGFCGVGMPIPDDRPARFSPDGSYLLSWVHSIAVLSDPVTGDVLRSFDTNRESPITAYAFSNDGLWLAVGTWDGSLSLWDVPTGSLMVQWPAHPAAITDLAFAGPGRLVSSSADLTALMWDLRPRKKMTRSLWDALDGDEPSEAYRAVWMLATDPNGPAFLRSKIPTVPPVAAETLNAWINQLGADRYRVREEAVKALQREGRRVEAELRSALAATKSEEVRMRLGSILAKVPRERNWDDAVQARAVAAMELAATAEARKLLAEWAAGAPGARLTTDAKAALGRIAP